MFKRILIITLASFMCIGPINAFAKTNADSVTSTTSESTEEETEEIEKTEKTEEEEEADTTDANETSDISDTSENLSNNGTLANDEATIEESIVRVVYGYTFSDGSFDTWMASSGAYIGGGYVITSLTNIAFTGSTDSRYSQIVSEKEEDYTKIGVSLKNYGTVSESMSIYVITPDGNVSAGQIAYSNENSFALLSTSLTDSLIPAATVISSYEERDAHIYGYSEEEFESLDYFYGSATTSAACKVMDGTILIRNGRISVTSDVADELIGSVIANEDGEILGLITKISNSSAIALASETFAESIYEETDIIIAGSEIETILNNKAQLESMVQKAECIDMALYTEESAQILKNAISKASQALNDAATDEYEEMCSLIEESISALEDLPVTPFYMTQSFIIAASAAVVLLIALIVILLKKRKKKEKLNDYSWLEGESKPRKNKKEKKRKKVKKKRSKKQMPDEDNDDTELFEDDGTSLLVGEAYLVNDKERIAINKNSTIIGRSPSADAMIKGNKSVGRSHARIDIKDGAYYITDLNSMNGTYVNKEKLKRGECRSLENLDIIRFADEEYELHT